MSQSRTLQQTISKGNKKTVIDYVTPHAHKAIPNALDDAKNDYYNERISKAINLSRSLGATDTLISQTLGVDNALISRKFPKGEDK